MKYYYNNKVQFRKRNNNKKVSKSIMKLVFDPVNLIFFIVIPKTNRVQFYRIHTSINTTPLLITLLLFEIKAMSNIIYVCPIAVRGHSDAKKSAM